jgi:hypothetical protein
VAVDEEFEFANRTLDNVYVRTTCAPGRTEFGGNVDELRSTNKEDLISKTDPVRHPIALSDSRSG